MVSLSISRGRENRAIKFISLVFMLCFPKKETGLSSRVCHGKGTAVHMEKRKLGQRL